MKDRFTSILYAVITVLILWGFVSLILLYAPGNCYDTPCHTTGE